jgi:hypothetical protein
MVIILGAGQECAIRICTLPPIVFPISREVDAIGNYQRAGRNDMTPEFQQD